MSTGFFSSTLLITSVAEFDTIHVRPPDLAPAHATMIVAHVIIGLDIDLHNKDVVPQLSMWMVHFAKHWRIMQSVGTRVLIINEM